MCILIVILRVITMNYSHQALIIIIIIIIIIIFFFFDGELLGG